MCLGMKIKACIIFKKLFEKHNKLLLEENEGNSHFVVIKDFARFIYKDKKNTQKKIEKILEWNYLQVFSRLDALGNHQKNLLEIHRKQSIKISEKR